jgi:hypothetical protein
MTTVLSCLMATVALAADPSSKGLPLGIPPAPEDVTISRVAPPRCLFYVDWAGTAAPSPASRSETERLLAEPEVQDFLNGLGTAITGGLRKADEDRRTTAASEPADLFGGIVGTFMSRSDVGMESTCELVTGQLPGMKDLEPSQLPDSNHAPAPLPAVLPAAPLGATAPLVAESPAAAPRPLPTPAGTPLPQGQPSPAQPAKPTVCISARDYGDWLNVLLTHPTAVFVEDVNLPMPEAIGKPAPKPVDKEVYSKQPQTKQAEAVASTPDAEVKGGMVISLGPDAARLHATLIKYLRKAKQARADTGFERIKIDGKTWYRSKPAKPGDKNRVTFGFHGKYLVVGVGSGVVEGILARWNQPAPAWLTKAREQTQVPRRTGIVYLNCNLLREKLLPLATSKNEVVAVMELLGFNNVDALISTTGLEDYGMINRVLMVLDGKPRGMLDIVADRPLEAKDLESIPSDALLALAARIDLKRTMKTITAAYEKSGAASNSDLQKAIEECKKQSGVDLCHLVDALGDSWCVYNSPAEGEFAFLGWTTVVSIRDRAALIDAWERVSAVDEKTKQPKANAAKNKKNDGKMSSNDTELEFRKCRFAGHDIYYVAGSMVAPAFYVSEHEMVVTMNVPAMKAFLARKNHRSLATQPGVRLALNDSNRPVALGYCDTPKLFDFLYPLFSLYGTMGAGFAHQAKIDLDPTFWPSAPAIRSHLRPDVTTVQRTPNGLQLTCRYCLPSGGVNAPLWLIGLGGLGSLSSSWDLPFPMPLPSALSVYTNSQPCRPTDTPVLPGQAVNSCAGNPAASATSAVGSPATTYAAPVYSAAPAYGGTTPTYGNSPVPQILPTQALPATAPAVTRPATTNAAPGYSAAPAYGVTTPTHSNSPAPQNLPSQALPAAAPAAGTPATAYVVPAHPAPLGYSVAAVQSPYSSSSYNSPATGQSSYAYPGVVPSVAAPARPYAVPPAPLPAPYGSPASPATNATVAPTYVPKAQVSKRKVTVTDVITLTKSEMDEPLIIAHIYSRGLAGSLQPADVANLQKQGVSAKVIEAMRQQSPTSSVPNPVLQ